MEEDCVSALYGSLGLSAGAALSSDDVSLLFCKVFHVSSNSDEAHEAMKKIARGDDSWSCSGQNVLDVLLKLKMEREKKEMSYWDFQLLNSGNLSYLTEHQRKDTGTFCSLTRGLVGRKERCERVMNVKRLKKAAGQSWARLASDGVNSILPFPWQGQRLGLRGQAWGCISLSDVLLLVEVKYDAVMLLLYREMLQKHHTEGVWETLPPWQRHQEVEMLGELVQDALESADTLGLALLPGALRIYKTRSGSHLGIDSESVDKSWSAVSSLNELNTFRQQEQKTLTALGQRLREESLILLCLYIHLATHRAQREKTSHGALLAARQSWEAWPQVASPCRAEQATLWLHNREEGEKEDFKTLQQKTELQLLVLTQELERKHLIMLLHQISVEDLQESDTKQASLKAGCIRRLRQIHHQLQTQSGDQTPSEKTNFQNKTQEKSSQILEDCAMFLLTYLIELQEVQASYLLQALKGQNAREIQDLRDKYEAEIEAQRFTNLLHLLMSDDPLTSGSKLPQNTSSDQTGPVSSHNGEIAGGSVAAQVRSEQKEVHSANVSAKQEVCAGCGVVMEDLPYLEISCAPEARGDAPEGHAAAEEEEQNGTTNGHENYEKQRSLITFAWSKPAEEDTGYEEKAADEETEPSQDGQSSMKTQLQSTQCEKTVQERIEEEQNQNKEPDQPDEGDVGSDLQTENLQVFSPHSSGNSSESTDDFCSETSDNRASASREVSEVEPCPSESKPWDLRGPEHSDHEDLTPSQGSTTEGSFSETNTRESTLMEKGHATHPVSAVERERTMRNLVDMQRKFDEKHQRDKERQFLRVQERLAIIQNRKAKEDLLGLKNTDRLIHLTQDLPTEDKSQQKTVVKERLEQLRRERSYIMQSKRDRNTMGFKELLAPVHLHNSETDGGTN